MTLIAAVTLPAYADYAPGELIVKLRRVPARNSLDQITETGVERIDRLMSRGEVRIVHPMGSLIQKFRQTESIVHLTLSDTSALTALEVDLSDDPDVEWVTRNHIYYTNARQPGLDDDFIPNDTLFPEQWWLTRISAPAAWELTRGDSSILIGIIDSGVDYLHPDLAANIWRNWADADSDGVDDDGNGFIDDVVGWDFVDAPSLPSGGDSRDRDNDPMDEHGHGTYVAGIAAAETDNETCIASVAPHCRIMCLRAGNISGYFEEDDVAAALLYGAANGAAAVTMSFGDVVLSPLLHETVQIAYQEGVVLVASAGNAVSTAVHYPSGYPEVISVGATDPLDHRADFSNYGPSVDVMAPGYEIISTIQGADCGLWIYQNGTSYAVPQVAAAAGLLLAVNPSLSPADVLQIITTTADDLLVQGWDPETVHGRLNVRRAVEQAAFGSDVVARINSPSNDEGLSEGFTVLGEAWGAAFERWELQYGLGENPDLWTYVNSGFDRRYGDSLGWIDLPAIDTVMNVRLEAYGSGGIQSVDHVHLYVQRTEPLFESLMIRRMLDRDTYGDLVQVECDQVTQAMLIATNAAGDSVREDFGYVAQQHATMLSQLNYPGIWQVRIRLENRAGLSALSEPFEFSVRTPPFSSNLWERRGTALPHGYCSPFATDYDCDGHPELWVLPIVRGTYDALQIYEWRDGDFVPTGNTYGVHIPQAVGDADGDGLLEMMGRRGTETRIWEQSQPCGVFDSVVFEFPQYFVGTAFFEFDSTDERAEILARRDTSAFVGTPPQWIIYSVGDGYHLTVLDTVPNLSDGANNLGPPKMLIGDHDGDGNLDFVFGDYDGDIVFAEYENGDILQKWTTRLPQDDATSYLAGGDFDGDGIPGFVAGCCPYELGGTESQRRSRHWEYFIFEAVSDDYFVAVDSVFILGSEEVRDHPASVMAGDVSGNGIDEILISAFPDFYIIQYNPASGKHQPVWYYEPCESNVIFIADWDHNGVNESFVSDGTTFQRIEAASGAGSRPLPPLNLTGLPTGPESIVLNWQSVAGADSYGVYRTLLIPDFELLIYTGDTTLALEGVEEDVAYTYAVTTVNQEYVEQESAFSNYTVVAANAPPQAVDTARFFAPHFVEVEFSEPMGESALVQRGYRLSDGRMPSVVSPGEGGRVIFLAFEGEFPAGWYEMELVDLRDAQGSALPADESPVVFEVLREPSDGPHIVSHRIIGGPSASIVEIRFSAGMSATVLESAHYLMDAPRSVQSVAALLEDRSEVRLLLDPRYPVGSLGMPARLKLRGIENENGVPLDTAGGAADLVLGGAAASLAEAFVFPNPYKGIGADGESVVTFAGLPEQAVIRVFTIHGLPVKEIHHENASGASRWDLTNEEGDRVASGIYLYTIESGGLTERGKLAIMR